ncbi:stage III sporulation protein AA [Laceyella putida]|uniref:Stage III sporulation protein AA n=1 Tax=Laceyella putida TaxID=110101 RepID=A0ABW2RIS6_9BACL
MPFQAIYAILPPRLREAIRSLPAEVIHCLEEIRIRQDRPLEVITPTQAWFVNREGALSRTPSLPWIPTRDECLKLLNLISNHSLYALEEELRRGFVTVEGGHRIGLVGRVVVEKGFVKHLREITGFNIRIARQVKGVGDRWISTILHDGQIENVLIVSPPQCGKTTLIRDLARLAGTGGQGFPAYKVGIVDERSEIAGCLHGVPQHDVGLRTDVLDGCPKAEGMMMMIRSMSPDILVVDELGRAEDSRAIHEAIYAGVSLFATVHGQSIEELTLRPTLAPLLEERVFSRIMILSRKQGPGTVEKILDDSLRPFYWNGKEGMVVRG